MLTRRGARLALLASVAAAALSLTTSGAPAGPERAVAADQQVSSFTFAVLPDTQFYSRYAPASAGAMFSRYGSEPFSTQTAWLAANADELEIPFVSHVGDVVDRVGRPDEWTVADAAMKKLEDADVPYSILAGNHDVRDESQFDDQADLASEPYLQTFTPARAAAQGATFGGRDSTGFNEWHTFTAQGRTFLVLALHWKASQQTLTWAKQVIADHPTLPVILTTHQLLNIADDGESPRETDYGQYLWDNLIQDTDQIFLTFNGHYHGASRIRKTNSFGHSVDQVVIDYQMAYLGGNGYLGLYEFDFTNDRIRARTVSPWVVSKPKDTLTQFDRAVLTGKHQEYELPIDFEERFAGFAPAFGAGAPGPSHTSRADAARELILRDYTEPEELESRLPTGPDDYPKVDGTLVHWRYGDAADGTVVKVGDAVRDITGNGNTLTRAPLNEAPVENAQESDVVLTTSKPPYSADGSAICFRNADRNAPRRLSYLRTAPDAPLNDETFPNGYTIETFMKIDAGWTAAKNMWMTGIAHGGQRRDIPGVRQTGVEMGATPFNMTFSNLKEIQWSVLPATTGAAETTNWSGEIPLDKWLHVAAVHDPGARTTTLYVDGAPVLRNVANGDAGIATLADAPWIVGAGQYDRAPNGGFNGCLGEIRMVDRPLPASQWLTARVATPDQPGPEQPGPQTPKPEEPEPETPKADAGPSPQPPAIGSLAAATPLAAVTHPRLTGTVRVGRVLRAVAGRFSLPGVGVGYQWIRDGQPITGATGATYRVRLADIGHRLSVRVTGRSGDQHQVTVTPAVRIPKLRPVLRLRADAGARGRTTLTLTVRAEGLRRVSGRARFRIGGRTVTAPVRAGVARVRVRLAGGRHTVTASFGATAHVAAGAPARRTVRVG